ncbi:MAG: Hsp20/alpha crystallin family protein [Candidatus Berkelbacteria bacterium]|nr:Hsp20/alpha crystallin family protein [Candidatus Berkelbacteria bacterium]
MSDKNFAKIFGRDATEESSSVQVDEKPTQGKNDDEAVEAYEGQLAIDVYQTEDEIIVKTPIAGVRAEDLDISVTDDVLTVKGERKQDEKIENENYLVQECYWGSFSRSYILPVAVDAENASASIKDGVLVVTVPKEAKAKTRVIQVQDGK